jgi:hypothetical protein
MTEIQSNNVDKVQFPKGRISAVEALRHLENATGLSSAFLLEKIPELKRAELSFGLHWPSDNFHMDSEVGRFNSDAVRDFIEVHVPVLDVEGKRENNLSDVNRSYHINVQTSEIHGFPGFYDAGEDLGDKYATARRPD